MAIAKREKAWQNKIQPGKQYPIDEALALVKEPGPYHAAPQAPAVQAVVGSPLHASGWSGA